VLEGREFFTACGRKDQPVVPGVVEIRVRAVVAAQENRVLRQPVLQIVPTKVAWHREGSGNFGKTVHRGLISQRACLTCSPSQAGQEHPKDCVHGGENLSQKALSEPNFHLSFRCPKPEVNPVV
jgi:hypothetical protein